MKPDFNLDDFPKKQPYHVPEDYFDKLPNRIMQRVTAEPKSGWSWLPTFSAPLRVALASVVLLLAFVGVFFLNQDVASTQEPNHLAQVSDQEIMDYLLTSERLETADLTELSLTGQDLTYHFIPASNTEIESLLENRDLYDIY